MARYGGNNLTLPSSCNYTTEGLFTNVYQACGKYIDVLQICPTNSVTPADRLLAANQTASCLITHQWANSLHNSYTPYSPNYTIGDPVAIEASPDCHYPDFLPILRTTCSYDLSRFNSTCSNNTGASYSYQYTQCQTEAAIQYVRCTLQKSPDDVSPCVSNNAVKVDWLPQIQTYTGAKTCPNVNSYLAAQGIHILRHVIGALLTIFIWPTILNKARKRFSFIRRLLPNTAGYIPNFNPWVREKRYTLKATRLLQSIGREVLVAYLTVLVLEKSGHFATSSFNTEISFYVIRPRPAPFIGFLGIFEPWSQQGLAELVVDGMLSFVAGTNVASKYFSLINHPPDNPAAPVAGLKNLAVGAIMTCIPAFAVLAITFLVSMAMASDDKGKKRRKNDDGCANFIGGLCIWTFTLMIIAIFICLLPLVALIEMISSVINTIQRKRGKNKKGQRALVDYDNDLGLWSNIVRRSPWEEPLTTTSGKFRVLYTLFVLSSFIINIGNWLFFASYLTLEGEMYCPVKFKRIMAIWILVPLGIDLVFYAFRVWTSDTYFDTHGHEALGL